MGAHNTEAIHLSLQRCNRNPRFLQIFYETFFDASPEVREKFAHTDMKRQVITLEASLYMCILAFERVPYAVHTIKHLGDMHHDLGIPPSLYEVWLDSLMAAVAACDEALDADLESAWRSVMRRSIEMMLSRYHPQE